ncbi:MAG: polyketide antibiotic transporter [Actinobacteria bacterium]|nr:polyketide antibiotic transporter [Actinomycetota bacterium]
MGASAASAPRAAAAPRALARRAFADGRVRTLSFAVLFAFMAYVNVRGYEHSFPTMRDRLAFLRSFGNDASVRLFYGEPYDLLHAGGYVAWRVGGAGAIFAAAWGLLAAVRALRTEEDAGRWELLLAGTVRRRDAFLAVLAAIAGGWLLLWLGLWLGCTAGGLPAGGSAYLALAALTPALVFAGVGALVSQVAPTRRVALELGMVVLLVAFLLRTVADTSSGATWLRWATPLGWAEMLRPFADPRPLVLLLPFAASFALLTTADAIARERDVGSGLIASRDRRAPRLRLLGSPTAQALRLERGSLLGWLVGVGLFAFVVGVLSTTFEGARLSSSVRDELARYGVKLLTPSGILGFYFLFFVLAISLFACAQVVAARREEAGGQLETLLALPAGRLGWLAGRLALALGGAVALALLAALLSWAGARTQGAPVSLADMLGAAANCLPAALLFLGLSTLAFGAWPRATTGIAYGLVTLAFVWQLFGAALGAPDWLLGLSPFHHVGLVPAQSFKALGAAIMLALAALALAAAFALFARRDLTGE